MPPADDLAGLTWADRACLDLAPGRMIEHPSFPIFHRRQPAQVRWQRRSVPALRLAVLSDVVVIGGGMVLEPASGTLMLESFTSSGETTASANTLVNALRFMKAHPRDGAIYPDQHWSPPARRIEDPVFHLTYLSDINYTHFMLEVLPKLHYWLLLPEPRPRLLVSRAAAERLAGLLALYGVGAEQLVVCPTPFERPVAAARLYLGAAPMLGHAPVLASLQSADAPPSPGPKRIFVTRRGDKSWFRKLLNEESVAEFLAARGFGVLAMDDLALAQQVALFRGADCVAGIYGGALFNTIFSAPGARVLSLTSPDYHRTILDAAPMQLRGATVLGESFTTKLDSNNSPFVVDMEDLRAACDHLGL
ncbi:glycosyltransferase family 61 protein [Roseomonas populi]|uniref:Glycosyltransferase family 61 protein n=1 Tax=Roseomonas populi TaxID=3121582 RepID=A0ABT1X557_9PROT|nr:glycosyltransferase family 61 protein [Roseomonas pecuniae]MCR0982084.1 glycosyltransferase family 61 protein [Roseomonas pecuniae]